MQVQDGDSESWKGHDIHPSNRKILESCKVMMFLELSRELSSHSNQLTGNLMRGRACREKLDPSICLLGHMPLNHTYTGKSFYLQLFNKLLKASVSQNERRKLWREWVCRCRVSASSCTPASSPREKRESCHCSPSQPRLPKWLENLPRLCFLFSLWDEILISLKKLNNYFRIKHNRVSL